MTYNNMA